MPTAWCLEWMLGLRDMIQSTSSLPEAHRRYTQLADLWSLSTDCELSVSSKVRSVQPTHAICGLGGCTPTNRTTVAIRNKTENVRINIQARSCNHYRGTAISNTYTECVSVALGIRQAMHMRRILLSSVGSPCLQYFCPLSN